MIDRNPDWILAEVFADDGISIKWLSPAIISREDWDAVQQELERREQFKADHEIRSTDSCRYHRFYL